MRFNNLDDWLAWQESLNPKEIDLGLHRIAHVLSQMGLSETFQCPLITIAGTNGKGSLVAMIEAIALAAGLKVCSYTSPHLFRYNERIKINGQPIDDDQMCKTFNRIDKARGDLQLTYFEFATLAAIDVFFAQQPDLVILEVGLGGRLDAVNIMDADVSVITSIAIDHVDWLGDDRESIGFEKAGVFRAEQTVICGDIKPPVSVLKQAENLQCTFIQAGQHFQVVDESIVDETIHELVAGDKQADRWLLKSCYGDIADIPQPALLGAFQKSNAATAILALQSLQKKGLLFSRPRQCSQRQAQLEPGSQFESDSKTRRLKLNALTDDEFTQAVYSGVANASLPGRFQLINTCPKVYVDVAHNPHAAQALATQLELTKVEEGGLTWSIMAMLSDKDVPGVIENLCECIDRWCFAGLDDIPRGLSVTSLQQRLSRSDIVFSAEPDWQLGGQSGRQLGGEMTMKQCTILPDVAIAADTVEDACKLVLSKTHDNDRIIIFGSFYTVAQAIQFFQDKNEQVQ